MNSANVHSRGSIAIAVGAGMWGLFWIPLRHLDQLGLKGLWAVALTLATCAAIAVPITLWRGQLFQNRQSVALIGVGIGVSTVLYFAAMIFSDVIRVIFLFYLLPVWATLTSRIIHGTPITARKMAFIGFALLGLFLLLGGDGKLPVPENMGDWFGLLAGFFWGLSLTLLRGMPDIDPYASAAAPFVFGAPLALVAAFLFDHLGITVALSVAQIDNPALVLALAILFGWLFLWPSMFAQVWGARLVPSSTAALLTMSEIVVATGSAWLLIGSALGPVSAIGGILIVIAALADLLMTEEPEKTVGNEAT